MLAARETKCFPLSAWSARSRPRTTERRLQDLGGMQLGDLSGLSAKEAGAALEAHIAALFDEVEGMVPEAQLVQLFRLQI